MALVKCSVCGMEREDDGKLSSCPMCGGAFVPVEKPVAIEEKEMEYSFDPELLRAQLYEISLPAVHDEEKTDTVIERIKTFLEKRTKKYPWAFFKSLWSIFPPYGRKIERDRESRRRARSRQVSNAMAEYKTAMNKPTPSLGFSLITNNTIDAATYVGLAAFEEKKHRIEQETAAIKKFTEDIQALGTSAHNGDYSTLRKAIDRLVDQFSTLHNAYTFVEENKDFYQNPSQYDVGISIEGVNIYQLLTKAVNKSYASSGFIGEYSSSFTNKENWILRMLEGAGYIRYWQGYYDTGISLSAQDYYVTTGKYEKTILQNQYWAEHPEEKAAYDKERATQYAKAEELLKNEKYYDAAVTFGKLDSYRDAMQRSINIWRERILPLQTTLKKDVYVDAFGGYAVTANGTVLYSKEYQDSLASLRNYRIKQLVSMRVDLDESFIALDYRGQVVSKLTPYAATKLNASEWITTNVASIHAYWRDYLVFLYEDGTAAFWGKLNEEEFSCSSWNAISSIFCFSDAIIGLKTDGTIIAMGEVTAFENTYCGWKNVINIQYESGTIIALTSDGKVHAVGNRPDLYNYSRISSWTDVIDIKMEHNTIVALASVGRVFAEGPESEKYNLVYKWGDIVSVDISEKGVPLGITKIGSLRYGSTWEERSISEKAKLGELLGLRGIVSLQKSRVGIAYALKADGTVYVCRSEDHWEDYTDWKNIIAPIDMSCAIRADGTLAVWKIAAEEKKNLFQNWKLFEHIDTVCEERKQAVDEYSDTVCEERKQVVDEYRSQAVSNQKKDAGNKRDKNQQKEKSGGCYIATAVYGSYDCPQVWTLRRFRDLTLKRTWYGRTFIRTYYAISPTLVKWFGESKWFKNIWKHMLDRIVNELNANGVNDKPYED